MPKLDGITATNLIRKFDRGTPIISMTANSKPNEIRHLVGGKCRDVACSNIILHLKLAFSSLLYVSYRK